MARTKLGLAMGALALTAALLVGTVGARPAAAGVNRVVVDYAGITDGTSNTFTTAKVVVNHEEQ